MLSEVPFDTFSGLTTNREQVKENIIPGFEIKGRGSGLAYCTPSLYDGPIEGERYQLVEGSVPAPRKIFDEFDVSDCEKRLEEICQLYGTSSFDSNGKIPMSVLLSPDFAITKGNNRKNPTIRVGMHYLIKEKDEETAEKKTKLWNEKHCKPPLSYDVYREFPDAWAWANDYHERNKKKVEEGEQKWQHQQKHGRQDGQMPKNDKIVIESSEHIKAKYHIATIWETGQMYYFKDGKHVLGAERIIEEECFALFQYDAKSNIIEEVKKAIMRQTYHDSSEFDADPNIINVKNGLYHIKEKTLTEHTPDYLSLNQKPIIYDPNGQCPEFRKFEGGCLYHSQIKTANQCAAATFYRGNLYEHYVIHVGHGSNGKSKFNNTMEKMHGSENVSHVAFNDISKDRFALSDLENKDLNIDNEPSGGVIRNTAILKKLSGQEMVRTEQKNVKAHDVKLHAKIWFSTNDIPDIQEDSIGRFRREIAIMWPYTFKPNPSPNNPTEKLDDPYIEEKITTDAEISGIFKMLMDELHDILYKQNKRIYVDMSDIDQRRKHRELLKNPIPFFVDEVIDLDNSTFEHYMRKDDLYKIYENFCQLNKVLPEEKENFGRKFKVVIGKERIQDSKESTKDPKTGKRAWIYTGIKVKPEWLDEEKRGKQTSLLTRKEEEEEQEENVSYTKEGNPDSEKKASGMPGMSVQNGDFILSKQQNNVDLSLASRLEITSDTEKNAITEGSKREISRTSRTSRTPIVLDDRFRDIIHKAMLDSDGITSKGYFTQRDWIFELQMWPNEHWTENEAEQTLYQLIHEDKIEEFEPDKFRPSSTNKQDLNPTGGA